MTARGTLLIFALGALFLAGPLDAQPSSQLRLVTVVGNGQVKAKPDQATLSAGVITQGKNAADALAANSRAMNQVFFALRRMGIPERSIQTSGLSVMPEYADKQPNRVAGYRASNTIAVIVNDLDRLGPAIDALVASGANSLGDISFGFREPKVMMAQAREAAVRDATDRAQALARAAGIALGPIQSINDSEGAFPVPMRRLALMRTAAADSVTPVSAGEEAVTASVTISWEIR